MTWKPFVRAVALSVLVGAALTSVVILFGFLLLPMIIEPMPEGGVVELLVAALGLLVITLPFTLATGVPLVLIFGGAMTYASIRWPAARAKAWWIAAGLFGAVLVWFSLKGFGATTLDAAIKGVVAAVVGIVTALTFRSAIVPTIERSA